MKCADCRWYNYENELCLKDGYSVFNPEGDDPCKYVDNMTVFDRITASPEALAPLFVRKVWTIAEEHIVSRWVSAIVPDIYYESESEAIAATVAKLKEIAQ